MKKKIKKIKILVLIGVIALGGFKAYTAVNGAVNQGKAAAQQSGSKLMALFGANKEKAKGALDTAKDKVKETGSSVGDNVGSIKEKASEKTENIKETVGEKTENAKESVKSAVPGGESEENYGEDNSSVLSSSDEGESSEVSEN